MFDAVPYSSASSFCTRGIWSLGGMMREIILVPFLNKWLAVFLLAYLYPLAISRLLMSFLTFHTAMFLSAIDSALMTADVFGSGGWEEGFL
jgi:hypothetical protein